MTDEALQTHDYNGPYPTEIKLHQRTRVLELRFGDGSHFMLPAEYLRVYSPSAESKIATERGEVMTGKETVGITRIAPVGNYAIRLYFNDGHSTGVYSWQTLYELCTSQATNWQSYVERLEAAGYQRKVEVGGGRLRLLYFAKLAARVGREEEDVEIPSSVADAGSLLAWLRKRGGDWAKYLAEGEVQLTVNKQFAEPATPIKDGDEIALVPTHPR